MQKHRANKAIIAQQRWEFALCPIAQTTAFHAKMPAKGSNLPWNAISRSQFGKQVYISHFHRKTLKNKMREKNAEPGEAFILQGSYSQALKGRNAKAQGKQGHHCAAKMGVCPVQNCPNNSVPRQNARQMQQPAMERHIEKPVLETGL